MKEKDIIIEVKFNDLPPDKYNYKYFYGKLKSGRTKTFYYNVNNPMPSKDEMIGLTWLELRNLCIKLFYDVINDRPVSISIQYKGKVDSNGKIEELTESNIVSIDYIYTKDELDKE